MKSHAKLALICAAGAACSMVMAQPAHDTKPAAKPTAPGQPPKPPQPGDKAPQAPEGMPDMQKMMEAYMEAAQPGKMHEHLQKSVGVWNGKTSMWMMPGAPASESTCTTTITSMMGGRFTQAVTKGQFDMGMGMAPFEGFGVNGYNNTTKKFEASWCDNMGTMMMNLTGTLSADGKVLTWNTKFVDPMTNKETWMREVETVKDANTMTLEMFGPMPDGKGEHKMMQIDYTRAPAAGGKDMKQEVRPAKPAGS